MTILLDKVGFLEYIPDGVLAALGSRRANVNRSRIGVPVTQTIGGQAIT